MRQGEAGFTLIELLVAMTILALLATVVTRALGSTNLVIHKGGARAAAIIGLIDLQQVLMREVDRARPFVLDRNGRPQPIFSATPERLRFVAVEPEGRPGPVFNAVELSIDDAAGDKQLVLRKTALGEDLQGTETALREAAPTLLDSGNDYGLRYYGSVKAGQAPDWVTNWPAEAPDIPRAVGITITSTQAGANTATPEIIATFPVSGSATCGEEKVDCRILMGSGS